MGGHQRDGQGAQPRRPGAARSCGRASADALPTRAQVCVKCDTEDELVAVARAAKAAGVVHSLITDAGRTQIAAGSRTVCGMGPAPVSTLDDITGHLKLL